MNYLYQIDYKILQDFGEKVFKSGSETKINFLENLNFSNFDADTIFILIVFMDLKYIYSITILDFDTK